MPFRVLACSNREKAPRSRRGPCDDVGACQIRMLHNQPQRRCSAIAVADDDRMIEFQRCRYLRGVIGKEVVAETPLRVVAVAMTTRAIG